MSISEKFEPSPFDKDETSVRSPSSSETVKAFKSLDISKTKQAVKSESTDKFISLGESLGYGNEEGYTSDSLSGQDANSQSTKTSSSSESGKIVDLAAGSTDGKHSLAPDNQAVSNLQQIEELTAKHNLEIEKLKKEFDDQVQEIKKSSFDEGFEQAKISYYNKNEEEAMSLLAVIEKEISRISLSQEEWLQKYSFEVAELVTTLLKRILPVYEKENGDKEIIAFIKQVLSYVVDKPKLQIQLPRNSSHLAKEISAMLKKAGAGFSKKDEGLGFQIVTNGILSSSDCVIKWQEGQIARKMTDLWKEIDETIDDIKNLSENKDG